MNLSKSVTIFFCIFFFWIEIVDFASTVEIALLGFPRFLKTIERRNCFVFAVYGRNKIVVVAIVGEIADLG